MQREGESKLVNYLEAGDFRLLNGFLTYCFRYITAYFLIVRICWVLQTFGEFVSMKPVGWMDKITMLKHYQC